MKNSIQNVVEIREKVSEFFNSVGLDRGDEYCNFFEVYACHGIDDCDTSIHLAGSKGKFTCEIYSYFAGERCVISSVLLMIKTRKLVNPKGLANLRRKYITKLNEALKDNISEPYEK